MEQQDQDRDGPDEALGALGWASCGAILALVAVGLVETEGWTWGILLSPVDSVRGLFRALVAIGVAAFLTRWLLRGRFRS